MKILDIITMGESMIAFEAQDYGPLRDVDTFRKWVGGAEDNVVIGLSRLGIKCGWFSRLGNDEFGKEILRTIRGEGIDVSKVIFDSDAPTGVFFVERRVNREFNCYYYRQSSAASRISPADIDPEYVKQARIVYLTGITPVLSESACKATEKMFRIALDNGQIIVFDPNLRLRLGSINMARSILIPLMQKSSYVLPGEDELKLLMECRELPAAIEKAHSLGISNLVIKTGSKGAILARVNRESTNIAGFPVKNIISTMGAGDCFDSGFIAGLIHDEPLEQCTRWGNAMGAFCLTAYGPYQALPDFQELQAFLKGETGISR
jgi:2-dehydro-3-deoxygluconokinase